MPRPYPPEFRQRAIKLARSGTIPIAQVARDLGIADSCLRNWLLSPVDYEACFTPAAFAA